MPEPLPTMGRAPGRPTYILHLYVSGTTPRSVQAVLALKHLCETYLAADYDLEIIDLYQQPHFARQEQIVAVPLLIKRNPMPEQRFVGDLADPSRLLAGLGLESASAS